MNRRKKSLVRRAGTDLVYAPKAVRIAENIPANRCGISINEAQALGARKFRLRDGQIVATWPNHYFTLAAMVEDSFCDGQIMWQPRDFQVLRDAAELHWQGRGDEAVALIRSHKGLPAAEMPEQLLAQAAHLLQ